MCNKERMSLFWGVWYYITQPSCLLMSCQPSRTSTAGTPVQKLKKTFPGLLWSFPVEILTLVSPSPQFAEPQALSPAEAPWPWIRAVPSTLGGNLTAPTCIYLTGPWVGDKSPLAALPGVLKCIQLESPSISWVKKRLAHILFLNPPSLFMNCGIQGLRGLTSHIVQPLYFTPVRMIFRCSSLSWLNSLHLAKTSLPEWHLLLI